MEQSTQTENPNDITPEQTQALLHDFCVAIVDWATPILNNIADALIPLIEYADSVYEAAFGLKMQEYNALEEYFAAQLVDEGDE
jgi:hypothetical protein